MFCSYCGHQLRDGVRFCESCGAAVPQQPESPTAIPTPEFAAEPQEVIPATPKKKKKLLPILAIALVLIVAAAVVFLLTGKQTIYLVSKTVTKTPIGDEFQTTTRIYEYDEEGRLIGYKLKMDYPDSHNFDYPTLKISYSYDEDGLLESAQWVQDESRYEFEYSYDDGILTDIEIDGPSDDVMEFEFNDEGLVVSVELKLTPDSSIIDEFDYHTNGVVKERVRQINLNYEQRTVTSYNENGQMLETITYIDGEKQSRQVFDFDENGNIILIEQYSYADGKTIMSYSLKIEPTYEKKQLVGMILSMEISTEDDESQDVKLEFECEWDGQECKMTCVDVKADDELMDEMEDSDISIDEIEIFFIRDDAGNLLHAEVTIDDLSMIYVETEYEEFKIPRGEEKPHYNLDPKYLFQIFGG